MILASNIVEEARTWVGVPFRHQGRSRQGIDCIGLPIMICRELGLLPKDFETSTYGRLPTGEMIDRLGEQCIASDVVVPGSLIVIAWTKTAAHVGICTGANMIHAYETVGKVVEHGYRGRWVRMTHSAWKLPGVIYE